MQPLLLNYQIYKDFLSNKAITSNYKFREALSYCSASSRNITIVTDIIGNSMNYSGSYYAYLGSWTY